MKKHRLTLAALAVGAALGILGASIPASASVAEKDQCVEAQNKCPRGYCGTPCRPCDI